MSKLKLSVAVGNYDRCRPLFDGDVQIDGVDPVFMQLSPEEIFFRAFRHAEFDICELSLSSSVVKTANRTLPYVGVPAFLSRMFRHSAFYVRKDRIKRPEDLKGKKVGLPEYQLTAMVWIRAFLEQDYGVAPEDIVWVRGGISDAQRPEKIKLDLPSSIRLIDAPEGKTISALLAEGEIDGFIAPRAPDVPKAQAHNIGWLFDDPLVEAMSYYKRRQIFPIMHILGVRRTLAEAHPWLPGAALKAFTEAKDICLERLRETSACKITMPFVDERLHADMTLMGEDFWSYGIEKNRHVLEEFFTQHHRQGLSSRRIAVEDLFHPATFEQFTI
ncbi:ABC transporter substrate-binding protein [Candidatus Viadribacter manganicus]|uniref:4,5-dihydroxyphthalate decarboxylase n=1 Tax=Candidatus Viadribacter manganicus TaxID=1759059 RepID=A0A1B1ALX5_9PROT|nr:ABC transporter substrate-binding protein [Candidatus Viadribacter manganicus]ANP47569.1 4,5-dihydroxyphthalate decarboxylase [Candidatus Viadribacter manganicus]